LLSKHERQIKLLLVVATLNLGVTASLVARVGMLSKLEKMQQKQIEEISPPFDILKAIIQVESGGNPNAYNKSSGACGLMQLTPIIYKNLCRLTKKEAMEPSKNIACGTLYMTHLLKIYNNNLELALLHYNSGYAKTNHAYAKKVLSAK